MRLLLFTASFFVVTIGYGQFTLSVKGGINNTTAQALKNQTASTTFAHRGGWQTGLQAEYQLKQSGWLLYAGLQLDKKSIFLNPVLNQGFQPNTLQNLGTNYQPTFLTLPLGTGYNYSPVKNVSLRFYTGLYGSIGVGGKYYSKAVYVQDPLMCDFAPCPEISHIDDRALTFGSHAGNNPPDDLARANWGAQFGAGVKVWQRFELVCMYNLGLSNIFPAAGQGGKANLRSLSVDVKMNIKTFKQPNKNR